MNPTELSDLELLIKGFRSLQEEVSEGTNIDSWESDAQAAVERLSRANGLPWPPYV